MEKQSFEELELNELLLKGVYLHGFTNPSPIQIKGIESINTQKDCLLQSQSGTGKTATYLLGVLNRLEVNDKIQAIIIVPTRELLNQVYTEAVILSKFTGLTIELCVGGTNIMETKNKLKKANLIIGTIGRLYHMINDKVINCNNLKLFVMDEADEFLKDGVDEKLMFIINKLPTNIQSVLISATINNSIYSLGLLKDPIKILLKNYEVVVDLISQFYIDVESEEYKFDTLLDLYNLLSTSQVIIFCNKISTIDSLKENLEKNNFPITSIHSKMTQEERNLIVQEFRDGKTRILLTTDLLSRGIDIPQVNLVVNYDLPLDKDTYIHRIGRCGRFGKRGVAVSMYKSLVALDNRILQKMRQFYKIDIQPMPNDISKFLN